MDAPTFHTNGTTNGHAPGASAADEAIDLLYSWMPPQAAPQPCPEAVFSLTLRGTMDGVEALLTARGQTAAEFKANLQAIRGLLDAQAPASPAGDTTPQCPTHGALRQGTRGWFCPTKLDDDTWCKSRGK